MGVYVGYINIYLYIYIYMLPSSGKTMCERVSFNYNNYNR